MIRNAQFSDCAKYRYWLLRKWSDDKLAMCIGLNPSTANATSDDHTIELLCEHLRWAGYGGFYMVNLYALISSKPKKLFEVPNAQGDNDIWITDTAAKCDDVIFCWGAFENISYRAKQLVNRFPNGLCFGRNDDGTPWHPRALFFKGIKSHESKLIPFKK